MPTVAVSYYLSQQSLKMNKVCGLNFNCLISALFLFFALFLASVSCQNSFQSNRKFNPVVLFPGLGGSQLEAKLLKDICCRKAGPDFFTIWLNLQYLTPLTIDCLIEVLKLVKDESGSFQPNKNFIIKVPNFGNTSSVRYIDPNLRFGPGVYMEPLVEQLVKKGYQQDVSIRAVGYDFRLGIR